MTTTSGARLRTAALVAATGLVLAACAGSGGTEPAAAGGEPVRGGTLTIAYNTGTTTLDPVRCGSQSWQPCQALFGTLLTADQESRSPGPGMAESFDSTDGRVWTLTLRPDLRFTDGTPLDAAAVAAHWARVADPRNLSAARTTAESMTWEVVDPRTVRVTLRTPNHRLPSELERTMGMIPSPNAIRELGPDFGSRPVGAGPFALESWQRGTAMTLARNPGYWDQPRPYVDRLELRVIAADEQRLNALRSGELDVMSTLVTEYATKAEQSGFTRVGLNPVAGTGLRMSWRNGDLADPDVREAVTRALDTAQIRAAVFPDDPEPRTFSPPGSPYHDPSATFPPTDLATAQQKIDGYLARTGKDAVRLTFKMTSGVPTLEQVSQLLQAQLQRVRGLQLEIVPQEVGAFYGDQSSGNYELLSVGLLGTDADELYDMFHSDAAQNTSGYGDPEVDAALERARTEADPAAASEAYKEAMRRLASTSALRPWFYVTGWLAFPEKVHGVVPAGIYHTRPELIWLAD